MAKTRTTPTKSGEPGDSQHVIIINTALLLVHCGLDRSADADDALLKLTANRLMQRQKAEAAAKEREERRAAGATLATRRAATPTLSIKTTTTATRRAR